MIIGIVDIGIGNLNSIANMLSRIGYTSQLVKKPDELAASDKIILPGMGSFDKCMIALNESGLKEELEKQVHQQKKPLLGICVGLQMLMRSSEEGIERGLHWIDGDTVMFDADRLTGNRKIPSLGWLDIEIVNDNILSKDLHGSRFYFAHSYHVQLDAAKDEWIAAGYGYMFTAGIRKENIYGVQFHPEKSHKYGMQLLNNFAELA